jgi:hypothetical protein
MATGGLLSYCKITGIIGRNIWDPLILKEVKLYDK